ncbi:hypothetical protein [Patulibacter sp. SYSU D01012]|uniref:hypothetical protein n=1 Tax=Patulibacter sp. SYSU D01012 TaxID=2817381 RepID=UPI001B30A47C|nr:hypothetical protein [Patulibacter sp. SYSU D01012]
MTVPSRHEVLARAVERGARTAARAAGRDWSRLSEEERAPHRQLARRWAEFVGLDGAIAALDEIATKAPVETEHGIEVRTVDGAHAQALAAEALARLGADDVPADGDADAG